MFPRSRRSVLTHVLAAAGVAAALAAGTHARAQCSAAATSHLGGDPKQLQVRGNLGYVIYGGELRVIDITNIAAPALVGSLFLPVDAAEMVLSGNHLYLAALEDGLVIIDVSAPASPAIVATVPMTLATDVAVASGLAHVVSAVNVVTVDVANPAAPAIVGTYFPLYGAKAVAASGTTLYVGTGVTLEVLDVANPAAPAVLDTLEPPDGIGRFLALDGTVVFSPGGDGVHVVTAANPAAIALVTTMTAEIEHFASGLMVHDIGGATFLFVEDLLDIEVFDVTNALSPTHVASLDVILNVDFDAAGSRLFVSTEHSTSPDVLEVYDLAVPAAPVLVSQTVREPDEVTSLATLAGVLLAADDEAGIHTIDPSNPAAPVIAATFPDPLASSPRLLAVHPDSATLYAVSGDTITVYNASNPAAISVVRRISLGLPALPIFMQADANDLVTIDSRGAQLFDLSTPTSPVSRGTALLDHDANGNLTVAAGFAYVVNAAGGVEVVQLRPSGGGPPTVVRTVPPAPLDGYIQLAARPGVLAALEEDGALVLIDTHTPAAATPVASMPAFASSTFPSVMLFSGTLLIVGEPGRLRLIDTADPALPAVVASVDIGFDPTDAAVVGGTLFLSSESAGIWGFSLPTFPRLGTVPADDVVCTAGPDASFSVSALHSGLTLYRWRKGATPLSNGPTGNGSTISGAFSPTLTITAVAPADLGDYSCLVTTICGSTITAPATLSATAATTITAHPADQRPCSTGAAAFSVAASGGATLAYRWQRESAPGSGVFTDLANAVTSSLTISGAHTATLTIAARPGRSIPPGFAVAYRCVVTGACTAATSNPADLTLCAADFNCDGNADPDDLSDFITCFFTVPPCPTTDFNADGNIDPDDLSDFITAFFAGC